MLKNKIKINEAAGKINPAHGFFILLRNPCKTKLPINISIKAESANKIKTNNTIKVIKAILLNLYLFPALPRHQFIV